LEPGSGSEEFRAAWADTILPALREFDPELILVSAGFDGHEV
jgi:acetoin utilization deacetylase AcuC-like enzyme